MIEFCSALLNGSHTGGIIQPSFLTAKWLPIKCRIASALHGFHKSQKVNEKPISPHINLIERFFHANFILTVRSFMMGTTSTVLTHPD